MALYYDLPVFKAMYDLTLTIFELTQRFSREYKFTQETQSMTDTVS
jgi:hypothetical protein